MTNKQFLRNPIQQIGDWDKSNFIHQISLQLLSTDPIRTLNQKDQFVNEHIH